VLFITCLWQDHGFHYMMVWDCNTVTVLCYGYYYMEITQGTAGSAAFHKWDKSSLSVNHNNYYVSYSQWQICLCTVLLHNNITISANTFHARITLWCTDFISPNNSLLQMTTMLQIVSRDPVRILRVWAHFTFTSISRMLYTRYMYGYIVSLNVLWNSRLSILTNLITTWTGLIINNI
jgi:hypothetical protein